MVGIKLEEKTIRGTQWALNTLNTIDGLAAATQLLAIIGAPLGAIAGRVGKGTGLTGLMQLESGMIGDAITKMSARIAEPATVELAQQLLQDLQKKTPKGGYQPVDFPSEFAANYGVLLELLAWAVEINFSSFFEGNPVLGALKEKASQSIRGISTGGSGG